MSNSSKTKIYNDIIKQKKTLSVYKNHDFNFEIPKNAFDRICQFYGKEKITPISLVLFNSTIQTFELKKLSTISHAFDEKQITDIFDTSNCYAIIPHYFHEKYNGAEIVEYAPKIDNKTMKKIIRKAGMQWGLINDYCDVQVITKEMDETSKFKYTITHKIIENVFKKVLILTITLKNGEKMYLAYNSYKKILEQTGIDLETILTYLHCEINDLDRAEMNNKRIPIYEKVKELELKDKIKKEDLKEEKVEISKGTYQCDRINKSYFDSFENNEKEASDLLNDITEKLNNQKIKINEYCKNKNNHIIEIKDSNNEKRYIRKIICDKILSEPTSEFDLFKTNDIYGNELILSKKELSNNKTNPSLIKIYNKKKQKEEFILNEIKDIEEKLNKFTYIRQEETFKGKNKNGESIEEKWLIADLECDDLPKLDESKSLYSICEKDNNFETIKKNLLETLEKDNNDISLYIRNKNFVPVYLVNGIKERVGKINNKNIKYTIKNQVNKKENIIIEYNDIFDEKNSTEFVLINNENNPEENLVVNKNDLYNSIKKWDNINNKIIITNEVNNNKIEINPSKIKIIKLEKEEIQKNNEDFKEEIKDSKIDEKSMIKPNEELNKKKIDKNDIKQMEDAKKDGIKERLKLRSINALAHNPEKTSYTIRRAVIRKKNKK